MVAIVLINTLNDRLSQLISIHIPVVAIFIRNREFGSEFAMASIGVPRIGATRKKRVFKERGGNMLVIDTESQAGEREDPESPVVARMRTVPIAIRRSGRGAVPCPLVSSGV